MKDVICFVTFVAKVLCLAVFIAVLKPAGIGIAQAPDAAGDCRIERSDAPACDVNVVAAIPSANIGECRGTADDGAIPRKPAC